MPLFLLECEVAADLGTDPGAVPALLRTIDRAVRSVPAEVVEFQVTDARTRLFCVVEAAGAGALGTVVREAAGPAIGELRGPDPVRLVGVDLERLKAAGKRAGYLVEWDLPDGLDMDSYLARKKALAPRYADVPEVGFLRTYVREDMDKCLCLYDAPNEELVRKAREAVDTPVDRLHALRPDGPVS